MKSPYTYYTIKSTHQAYKGVRMFRVTKDCEKVLQICTVCGDIVRKGKSASIGIYTISFQSFAMNYLAMSYIEVITEAKFNKAFHAMIEMMNVKTVKK